MKKLFILITIIITAFGYSQNCECTEYQKEVFKDPAMDTFNFSNGEKLRICPAIRYSPYKPYKNYYFKDFALENCQNENRIRVWGNLYCKAIFNQDTLSIIETVKLPVGQKRKFEVVNKSITTIYIDNGKVVSNYKKLSIRKYNQAEIEVVLKEHEAALKSKKKKNFEHLYSSLLVAGLSGNEKALEYFINFQSDFEDIITDPEIEDYNNLKSAFIETDE
ncbi:hypothetical protein AAEO56_06800 [Flavobacterium sp. DGU11]|uniref:DUF4476 domain-containing protein n=1 Tax=Flavobacterium arundinis TaxID=3139143 RepID=A0ABU9HWR8_9FLAO